jgi:hypothetical protein
MAVGYSPGQIGKWFGGFAGVDVTGFLGSGPDVLGLHVGSQGIVIIFMDAFDLVGDEPVFGG